MRHKHSRVPDFNVHISAPGDKFQIEFSSSIMPDGRIRLTESGRKNIQAEINSHLAETDMAVIIHKLQFGDTSVLSSKAPMYGDFTIFPDTYAEILDLVNRSEKAFEGLPIDVKNKFDNDRNKWFSSIGTDAWLDAMGLTPPSPAPAPVVPPVETPIVPPDNSAVKS